MKIDVNVGDYWVKTKFAVLKVFSNNNNSEWSLFSKWNHTKCGQMCDECEKSITQTRAKL